MDWNIVGHKKQLELLSNALQKGKLAHAYVFAGPEGSGKKTIVKKLAQFLLCENNQACNECPQCKTFIAIANADFLEIAGNGGIKIEQIRELSYKLSLKPYMAKHKVAVIDDADQMTTEAANALLKVLEEPKDYTYIILVTSNPNRLPKTILSRSQKINFGPLTSQEKQQLDVIHDEKTLEQQQTTDDYFKVFREGRLPEKLITAYEIAEMETLEIKALFEAWILKMETLLLKQPERQLAHQISQVLLSRKFLDQNVNSKLLLTNLMLNT